ncbi:hypothetical protein EJ05DRAFT_489469 [Pseudovirgaria hyperparasitica]|uniref:VWFA domain-containing protein n=1 Tax=Pseudovirgaria hyperparasitica TaxID=470096 RepID=A0A6A6VVH7_9PEZI|nr:uncharacterized protein EJ05DRAFT_489469 [Pseudovirgaria hyperparasitica]KAF2754233.1 hypothetical protein EJ05DRAFT_489469 [Pseudovirgaria hyperparasitica]
MVLEATMILLDNSEFSRNGDYLETRWKAQEYAVNRIHEAKHASNPESAVGLITMAGSSPDVLTTPQTEPGHSMAALGNKELKIHGRIRFWTAIRIAQMVLRNRQNKSQRQRIIAFICSPLEETAAELQTLAKTFLKKNNISIDVIAFGELGDNVESKLTPFIKNFHTASAPLDSHEHESRLLVCPPGDTQLFEFINSSVIVNEGGAVPSSGDTDGHPGGSGGGSNDFEYVDPSVDPELALALRMSYEEAKAREEKNKKDEEAKTGKADLENIPEEGGSGRGKDRKDDDPDKMDTA